MSGTASRAVEIYGSNTFSTRIQKQWLPSKNYKDLQQVLDGKAQLTPELATVVANTLKSWAISKGASHFCHWFHPLTGTPAEKHDAFLDLEGEWSDKSPIDRFSGGILLQSEPDASSFPSGGLRTTFEARGYTTWDPSSPCFILEEEGSSTLCIPSLFYSYHGTVMDLKMPLLRSLKAIDTTGRELLATLGHFSDERINAYLGIEQEFFLIEQSLYKDRLDLVVTGRTLLGAPAPKEQELGDHYFGRLPGVVLKFMELVQEEAYKLGIPIKTRHNEVAPRQFEIAPIFEPTNIATDHNILLMAIMKRIASSIGLEILLHEKPFNGMNGSGKHNNWSIGGGGRGNFLEPGETPEENLEFLIFLVCVIAGFHKRSGLHRASIACLGNDSRLGGHEAPPAIMSVYLGGYLDSILNSIETETDNNFDITAILHLGLSHIETIQRDYTDRNRTSSFAFTGNKFEFRAVPSSIPCSFPNTCLNLSTAEAIQEFNEELKEILKNEPDRKKAIFSLLKKKIIATKDIRFEGDGYSQEWLDEAIRRGLPLAKNTYEALKQILIHEDLFTKFNVLSKEEVGALYIIKLEQFVSLAEIEIKTLLQLVQRQVVPSVFAFQKSISESLFQANNFVSNYGSKDLSIFKPQVEYFERVASLLSNLISETNKLQDLFNKGQETADQEEKAESYVSVLLPQSLKVRAVADELETIVDKKEWPFPTYTDILCDTL